MPSYERRTWWTRHDLTKRLAEEGFLEAAVTTAFLIAAADGHASEEEYDALLDRLEILGDVDRDRIDELLTAAASSIEADGFEPCVARVTELIGEDHDAGLAALMVGMAIALADDDVSSEERELAARLVGALQLGTTDLDALIAEIRG